MCVASEIDSVRIQLKLPSLRVKEHGAVLFYSIICELATAVLHLFPVKNQMLQTWCDALSGVHLGFEGLDSVRGLHSDKQGLARGRFEKDVPAAITQNSKIQVNTSSLRPSLVKMPSCDSGARDWGSKYDISQYRQHKKKELTIARHANECNECNRV